MKRKYELYNYKLSIKSPFNEKIEETKEQVEAPSIYLDFRKTGEQLQSEFGREVLEEKTKSLNAQISTKHILHFRKEAGQEHKTVKIDSDEVENGKASRYFQYA